MKLDNFDQTVLDESGLATDIVKQFYGVNISQNSAKKYMAGIRMHLRHKSNIPCGDVPAENMEEVVVKADGSQTTKRMVLLSESEKLDPTKIMSLMGYDPIQWELLSCKTRRNYWDVSMKLKRTDSQGKSYDEVGKETNHAYMVTLTVKPIQQVITSEAIRKLFGEMKPPKLQRYKYNQTGMMLELPLMDFHLGKLAAMNNAGEVYDMATAEERYKTVICDILSRVQAYSLPIEKIIFPIGQDFFNFDGIDGKTSNGTQVTQATNWADLYQKGVELLIWAIEQLRAIAPVESMYVAGNHDKAVSFYAANHIKAHYHDLDAVTVDVSAAPRKYVHYGQCLIGYSHGDEDAKRIPYLMQVEQPQAWAESLYREWHLGHLHKMKQDEEGGIIIRRISAITGTDDWHKERGFVGAIKKCQAFVWDREKGKQLTIDSTVAPLGVVSALHGAQLSDLEREPVGLPV